MRLFKIFHAVKLGTSEEKRAFWALCKTAAKARNSNQPIGLTKIALEIWADTYESGGQPVASREIREAFASSFGSAAVVERQFQKMAADGAISDEELEKLSNWVAESAVNDLKNLTKTANVLLRPEIIGALTGAVVGAGVGAWHDKEDRTRGAISGVLPGAVVGATIASKVPNKSTSTKPSNIKNTKISSKLADMMQELDAGSPTPMSSNPPVEQDGQGNEAIASPDQGQAEAMEGVDRAHKIVDNMIFLANQVQLPQLAQELEQNREQIANHFADGNAYLPPELQHHFAQSEHAEAFMKKYKQRFGAPSVGGKKMASAQDNWLSWRTHR